MRRNRLARTIVNIVTLVAAVAWAFPVYWMVNSSFQPERHLLATPPQFLPARPTLEHFQRILTDQTFWQALGMSLGIALILVFTTTTLSLLAALALTRFRFVGRTTMVVAILVIQMIPAEATFLSQYRMLDGWGLLNSVTGLSLLYIAGLLPFVVWMMRGFVAGIPLELEEAAMVDGCSRLQAMLRVTLPLLAPGLVATSVFAFLHAWNEYALALIILSRNSAITLPLWLQSFQQGLRGFDWGGVMAGSVLITIPVMILFLLVQHRMTSGFVAGAVKG
ncbi:MAG: carbohydrate ABC transporter permease [Arachnia propionica]|uniref:carbohydrate ABC transporter permease n=1 Tax=Arachnia propionica TaxID=1750 RepID=UPI00270757FA|nr:carbohydrate ABC transporter permease [Arachnia propionica]